MAGQANFIVGPTASGKTDVAHYIAKTEDRPILSADSMLVYRDMDIATAKPTPAQLTEVSYYGVDVIRPNASFSTGAYLDYVRDHVPNTPMPIVAGGSGLYISALTLGLDEMPGSDSVFRAWAEDVVSRDGLEPLLAELKSTDLDRFTALKDPANPRRVIRALELARMGHHAVLKKPVQKPVLTGLNHAREVLYTRVSERVVAMYEKGLLQEAERLKTHYPALSNTALQGIGYKEAFAVLEHKLTEEQAIEQTTIRTRRLAKRQETWFRHQTQIHWVDVRSDDSVASIAHRVQESWNTHGPTSFAV